jgi:XTP/dITP diphosphohydrolase
MRKILVASQNKGKRHEIKALLDGYPLQILSPGQLNLSLQVREDGQTYQENATKKALAYVEASDPVANLLVLADDSGLEVAALDGQPGLHSARFSQKPGASDADRRATLLARLEGHPRPWMAQFRCVVALFDPQSGLQFSEGICPGEIIPDERGTHGFGYDPIFLVHPLDRTMAELTTAEKNRLSHRALAIQGLRPVLLALLGS